MPQAHQFTTYSGLKLDYTSTQAISEEISKLHAQETSFTGFPLAHLYRMTSARKERLKANDSALSDALNDHFDISVNPVVINVTDDNERGQCCIAYNTPYLKPRRRQILMVHIPIAVRETRSSKVLRFIFHRPLQFCRLQNRLRNKYVGDECQRGDKHGCREINEQYKE
jgi:hypothetical protein